MFLTVGYVGLELPQDTEGNPGNQCNVRACCWPWLSGLLWGCWLAVGVHLV